MIDAIIIDDEPNNIDNLSGLLKQHCPQVAVVATAMNADDGVRLIEEMKPKLIFLDIQMPGKSGFDILLQLSAYSFEIVLVTAFDNYGIQAIKFSALDYLLKPVNIEELKVAVNKACLRISEKQKNHELQNLITLITNRQERSTHKLALPGTKETRFVSPAKIIHCVSSNAYTTFYLESGEMIMVSKPIYEYEELLDDFGFIRIHQSHLVNKKYIKSWIKDNGSQLLLEDGTILPVSRNKKEAVAAALIHLK